MVIDTLDQDTPKSNVIAFQPGKRKGTIEPVRAKYDACRHESVYVNDGERTVTCQKCEAVLDAFTVLLELAWKQRRWLEDLDAWDARRESILSERYDQQWARDHDGIMEPPKEPELRKVWDVFAAALGSKFCRMYKRNRRKRSGPQWYGVSIDGGYVSFEYARSKAVPKAVGSAS